MGERIQNAKKIKAVVFDLDGVICSTDEYHYEAWKSIADSIGVPFDRTVNNRLRGISRMNSLEIILEQYRKLLTDKARELLDSSGCEDVKVTWGSNPVEPVEVIMQAAGLRG